MKTIISFIFILVLSNSPAFAQQKTPSKVPFTIDAVVPPGVQSGGSNYLASLSGEDLKNARYIFYTDSNSTVAHININGTDVRLTGGPNPEQIMAYTCKNYTVTLSVSKKTPIKSESNGDDISTLKIEGILTIYTAGGQAISKPITGKLRYAVKN